MADDEVRSEAVEAIFAALTNMDPSALSGLTYVTSAERARAEDLFLAAHLASRDHEDRKLRVWEVVLKRRWSSPPTWVELWNELDEKDIGQLRELYDALPDGLRRLLDEHDSQEDQS